MSVPLYASHRAPLEHHGPLGSIWRTPGTQQPTNPFHFS